MRKFALLAAVAGVVTAGSVARADFVFQTVRTTIASGLFAGDDLVKLQIQQTGTGTAQNGNVAGYTVALSSTSTTPQFFIRTWQASAQGFNDTTPASNTNADFGNQGIFNVSDSSTRGNPGSFVRMGNDGGQFGNYTFLSSTPTENGTTYTDGQAVSGFSVTAGEGVSGLPAASFTTLAAAVVPHLQQVAFNGVATATIAGSVPATIAVTDPAVPEPASLAVIGFGAVGLLSRRRRTA